LQLRRYNVCIISRIYITANYDYLSDCLRLLFRNFRNCENIKIPTITFNKSYNTNSYRYNQDKDGWLVRFLFLAEFDKNLRFRCLLCGRCCTGYNGGLKLELYKSDINFIASKNYKDFYEDKNGIKLMKIKYGMPCPFYENGLCKLKLLYGFFPWNCSVYPLQVVEHSGFFVVRINPAALEECPGLGRGPYLRDTLLRKIISGVVSIKMTSDPRTLPQDIALSLAEVRWSKS